jgi:hypothetical protein
MKKSFLLVCIALLIPTIAFADLFDKKANDQFLELDTTSIIAKYPDTYYSSIYIDANSFSTYEYNVANTLKSVYAKDVILRVVVKPSFSPEWALGINRGVDNYSVSLRKVIFHLWQIDEKKETVVIHDIFNSFKPDYKYRYWLIKSSKGIIFINKFPFLTCSILMDELFELKIKVMDKNFYDFSAEIDKESAERIRNVFARMIDRAKHSEYRIGHDGVKYYFSTDTTGINDKSKSGWNTGLIQSPYKETNTGILVSIADGLAGYAQADLEKRKIILNDILKNTGLLESRLNAN